MDLRIPIQDRLFIPLGISVYLLLLAGCATLLTSCGSAGSGDSNQHVSLQDVMITVNPSMVTLAEGQTAQFIAQVMGEGGAEVQWEVDGGPAGGTVSNSGLYQSPESVVTSKLVTLRAVSLANPARSESATVLLGAIGALPILNGPTGIAVEPSGNSALVTEFDSGEVSTVDLATGQVTTLTTGLDGPFGILLEPGGSSALVTEWIANRVTRVHRTDQGVTPSIVNRNLSGPAGIVLEASGQVLVAEEVAGRISRLSPTDNATFSLVTGGLLTGVRGIAVLGEGATALATGGIGHLVTVDIRPNAIQRNVVEIPTSGSLVQPVGIIKKSSENIAFTADESLGKIFKVDFSDFNNVKVEELASGLHDPRGVTFEDGERNILVAEAASGEFSRVSLSDCLTLPCKVTRLVSGLSSPVSIAIETEGMTALVTEHKIGQISRVDLITGKVTTLAEGLHQPSGMAVESGGSTILVTHVEPGGLSTFDKGVIERIDLVSGNTEQILISSDLVSPAAIALLPGGTQALVTDPLSTEKLFLVDLDNKTLSPLPTSQPFTQPRGFTVEPGGKTALITDSSAGKISRLTLPPCKPSCQVTTLASGLSGPVDVAVELGDDTALVLQRGNNTLVRIKIAESQVPTASSIIATGFRSPQRVAIEPGGNTALITEINPSGIHRVKLK